MCLLSQTDRCVLSTEPGGELFLGCFRSTSGFWNDKHCVPSMSWQDSPLLSLANQGVHQDFINDIKTMVWCHSLIYSTMVSWWDKHFQTAHNNEKNAQITMCFYGSGKLVTQCWAVSAPFPSMTHLKHMHQQPHISADRLWLLEGCSKWRKLTLQYHFIYPLLKQYYKGKYIRWLCHL